MCDLGSAGKGDSGNNDDLTLFYGPAHLRFTASGKLIINAPGGTEITSPTILAKASTSVTIETPITTNKGMLTTEGLFTYRAGMAGFGGSGGAFTTIQGNIQHTSGSITSMGRTIDGSHTHPYTDNNVPMTTSVPNA
jgi:phage gp45-like